MKPRTLLSIFFATPMFAIHAEESPDKVDFFEKKVRPILSSRCYECHSNEKKIKGGLALDSKPGWVKGGDTGPAIVPGKPDDSLFMNAVNWVERDLQMPPKKKLPPEEIAILEKWIQMGAPDPRTDLPGGSAKKATAMSVADGKKFWAYAPQPKAEVPSVKNTQWPHNFIDRFVLSSLESHELQPAPDASPNEILRRLTFTIIGLPPRPEQIKPFIAAYTVNPREALTNTLDQLMQSEQFGEKWGRHWLDVARFAESSGGGRTLLFKDAWKYRDYVISAYNRDISFPQFIREQIAGDLLPATTPEERKQQLTATGFLAVGPTIYEEQDKQRLRFDVIDEQIETIGKGFLGQTIGCARCHDHKFDPITQRDYYALAGIFASTRTLSNYTDNVVSWITTPLPMDPATEQAVKADAAKIQESEKTLQNLKNELADLKKQKAGIVTKTKPDPEPKKQTEPLAPGVPLPLSVLAGIVLDDSDAKAVGYWKPSTHTPWYFGTGYIHDDGKDKGAKSLTFTPKLPRSGKYEVRLGFPALAGRAQKVPIHIFHAMGDTTVYVDQSKTPDIEGRFVSLGTYHFEADGDSYVIISNEGTKGYVCADVVQFLPEGTSDQIADEPTQKGKADETTEAIAKLQPRIKEMEKELAALKVKQLSVPGVMSVREEDTIADTQIRIRGDVNQKGATVPRGFLSVAWENNPATFNKSESGRVALAEWLGSEKNPLTARVYVNRVWSWIFGFGLVRTPDNFATTGEAPSHPELLNYLAQSFIQSGWSTKALIREIILSRTWQREAQAAARDSKDPDNRLLSHANRRRLDAEHIRDSILAVSGTLDPTFGGPNIKGANSAASDSFDASKVEFEYVFTDKRRSVYTPAFRNNRLELFSTFDFGDISSPIGQRYTSTVAPQALYFMNHSFVIDQSSSAAKSMLQTSGTDTDKIQHVFQRILTRPASDKELQVCLAHLGKAAANPEAQLEAWSTLFQSLIGSIDFRYLN